MALILTAQLPEVTVNAETSTPVVNRDKRRELRIHRHPVAASFCIFDGWVNDPQLLSRINHVQCLIMDFYCSSILIVDPSAEEESLSTAHLTVVTDEEDRLCAVHKPGQSKIMMPYQTVEKIKTTTYYINSFFLWPQAARRFPERSCRSVSTGRHCAKERFKN